MRTIVLSIMMMSTAGCAAHRLAASADASVAPSRPEQREPAAVVRDVRAAFRRSREARLATIAERLDHFLGIASSRQVSEESLIAQAIVDLPRRLAVARELLVALSGGVGEGALAAKVDASIADLDVRSGQLALRLALLTNN